MAATLHCPGTLESGDPAFARAQAPIRLLLFDFDGVFTDNAVFVFEDGREAVRCSRFDGIGLRRLERAGVEAVILSTEVNPVVAARARKLKIGVRQGLQDKVAAAEALCAERGLALFACGFVGNDVNDIPLLQRVGLPLGVADSHPDIRPHVRWLTVHAGGQGAVREVCDAFGAVRGVPPRYP
jgi:YrbI family 3-deoxy-D-manno-octulosonate 8-phosphate phosphatase